MNRGEISILPALQLTMLSSEYYKGAKPKASKPSLDQNISQSKLNILKGDMMQEFTLEKLTLIQLF